jgi:DNA-binding IclR family transcriptional regulator
MHASAAHALEALEVVAEDPRGVPAKVVARRLGQSLSSVYYLLQSLTALGFVEQSPLSHGLYTLGPKIPSLYRGYVASRTLPQRLEPTLVALRDRARARAYLAAWSDADLEVACVRGRRGATELQDVSVGFRGAAHALALGKVLLAELPRSSWPSYLAGSHFQAYTPTTIRTLGRLLEELHTVQAQGYAVDVEEYNTNVCCVAAPVRDGGRRILAAIAVSVSTRRYRREFDVLRGRVVHAATTASAQFASLAV